MIRFVPVADMNINVVGSVEIIRLNVRLVEPVGTAQSGHGFLEKLDQGWGACSLKEKPCADAVEQALLFFDGQRYTLKSFVIMPNHVHVLVRLEDGFPLERIVAQKLMKTDATIEQSGRYP